MRILITAGPTREPIDAVRYISNPSTGKMGYAIARAARESGWEVCLVTGPVHLEPPDGVHVARVTTAAQMLDAAQSAFASCDAAVFAAAVCDHTPAAPADRKLHKEEFPDALKLVRTADIAATLSSSKGGRITVGFALETDNAQASALRKLHDKHLDYIVLNSPSSFGSDQASAVILGGEEPVACERMPKIEIARTLVNMIRRPAGH